MEGKLVRIDNDTKKELDRVSNKTGRTRKWIVSKAVEKYIERVEENGIY